jgi:hypothetical protein
MIVCPDWKKANPAYRKKLKKSLTAHIKKRSRHSSPPIALARHPSDAKHSAARVAARHRRFGGDGDRLVL